jgi:hypothetical protein
MMVAGFWMPATSVLAQGSKPPVKVLSFHAHRYQNFKANAVSCEVFGEVQNLSGRNLKGMTVGVEFMDEKGKPVAAEEITLELKILMPNKPQGEIRPLKPEEVGHFSQDTQHCPANWLEGRISYKIKKTELE